MDPIDPRVRRIVSDALDDPDTFWARAAHELYWARTWDDVFVSDPPSFRWFSGGRTNLCYNALDRHVEAGRGGHAALVAIDELGSQRVFTYAQLLHLVERAAAGLRELDVARGDRVTIYMPTCAEAIIGMLAAVRIGAVHSVVFAGFGAGALRDRIAASGSRVLLTADLTYRKGRSVALTGIVEEALSDPDSPIASVVVLARSSQVETAGTRVARVSWDAFMESGVDGDSAVEWMEANEPAFLLATSGTTATPKLAVHTHGGYAVWVHSQGRWCFGLDGRDVWWSTSDIGWIVGHSYIVYGPLMAGCTTIAYEGAIDHPDASAPWGIVEAFHVTGLFTSPTAVRLLMRTGTEPVARHDVRSLERIFCAGEVLNAPAWEWLQRRVFRDRVPVIDHMWQTETGGPVFGNPYGISLLPIKPGSATIALPGVSAEVVTPEGERCGPGEKGIMVLTRPFPGLIASLWEDPGRYKHDYWGRLPGRYWTGDAAHIDEDGYVWFAGRADEIIKIAGHRLGTIEVETALMKHSAVAEAGVTGRPDEIRGESIAAFVLLKQGQLPSDELRTSIIEAARRELGPVSVIGDLYFVATLPKTRSGKIMRRVLKAVVLDQDPGDVTTIEDEGSVEEARQAWAEMRREAGASPRPGASP